MPKLIAETFQVGDVLTRNDVKLKAVTKPNFFACDKCAVKFDSYDCRTLNCNDVYFEIL